MEMAEESLRQLHERPVPQENPDGFDRMLVCQGIEHDLSLVTPDSLITQYPIDTIW